MQQANHGLLTALDLSRLTGCSAVSINTMHKRRMIPAAVASDAQGRPLWDADDPQLAAWVDALQQAGYHTGPRNGA